jgi:hypothetical protein
MVAVSVMVGVGVGAGSGAMATNKIQQQHSRKKNTAKRTRKLRFITSPILLS